MGAFRKSNFRPLANKSQNHTTKTNCVVVCVIQLKYSPCFLPHLKEF